MATIVFSTTSSTLIADVPVLASTCATQAQIRHDVLSISFAQSFFVKSTESVVASLKNVLPSSLGKTESSRPPRTNRTNRTAFLRLARLVVVSQLASPKTFAIPPLSPMDSTFNFASLCPLPSLSFTIKHNSAVSKSIIECGMRMAFIFALLLALPTVRS